MKGAPRDLLPGDPICAPMRTVLAETTVALVRSLSEYLSWKDVIASAILKGLQEIKNVLLVRYEVKNSQKAGPQGSQQGLTSEDSEVNIKVRARQTSVCIVILSGTSTNVSY